MNCWLSQLPKLRTQFHRICLQDKMSTSVGDMMSEPATEYISLRLGPVQIHWFPLEKVCDVSTTSDDYKFELNGNILRLASPSGCIINVGLTERGFYILDSAEEKAGAEPLKDDESDSGSSDPNMSEGEIKEEFTEALEEALVQELEEQLEEELETSFEEETEEYN